MKVSVNWNELDMYFLLNFVGDFTLLVMGLLWNPIANLYTIRHAPGWGYIQVAWCVFFACKCVITWVYHRYYGR